MSNEIQLTAKSLFNKEDIKKRFQDMLGTKAQGFISSVLQIVSQSADLAKADPNSVLQAAAMAATLDLPLNKNLGFAYIIAYKTKVKGLNGKPDTYNVVAQFQMGYKGFIQLAQRTGTFKSIGVSAIYEGQLKKQNPLTGFEFDFDIDIKENAPVIGYAAYFQLLNGFEKTFYMPIDKLLKHGAKYSKSFYDKNGRWTTDFDAMAEKTVLKLLLSKFAPLSIEMQKAVISDQGVINNFETDDFTYIDNESDEDEKIDVDQVALMIKEADTLDNLFALKHYLSAAPELTDLFNSRELELKESAVNKKKDTIKNNSQTKVTLL
ncbi:MAG TPA: recombinase RecT [Mucilaginibacter sp.]|jgi:recombination protein RecT